MYSLRGVTLSGATAANLHRPTYVTQAALPIDSRCSLPTTHALTPGLLHAHSVYSTPLRSASLQVPARTASAIKIPVQDAARKSFPFQVHRNFVNISHISFHVKYTASCAIQVQNPWSQDFVKLILPNSSTSGGAFKSQDIVKLCNIINSYVDPSQLCKSARSSPLARQGPLSIWAAKCGGHMPTRALPSHAEIVQNFKGLNTDTPAGIFKHIRTRTRTVRNCSKVLTLTFSEPALAKTAKWQFFLDVENPRVHGLSTSQKSRPVPVPVQTLGLNHVEEAVVEARNPRPTFGRLEFLAGIL
ncbi:hypothetical protein DFH06DRAFT_1296998 [Mycena polygramma]|nr:hypothetical protein DFH06DRAFT_1296998 [Mycena polygramma]